MAAQIPGGTGCGSKTKDVDDWRRGGPEAGKAIAGITGATIGRGALIWTGTKAVANGALIEMPGSRPWRAIRSHV